VPRYKLSKLYFGAFIFLCMSRPLYLVGLALLLATTLAACESKSPAASLPTAPPQAAASPDTAHLVALSPQDSILLVGAAASPTPDSVLEIEESKKVTPELSVTIKGTLVSDAVKSPQRVTIIRQRDQLN
jgi:hypothetical protein